MTLMTTTGWPLAAVARCRTCAQPLDCGIGDDANRTYGCSRCGHAHPAAAIEEQITAVVRERDWMVAQHNGDRAAFRGRWSTDTKTNAWELTEHLVDWITVDASRDIYVRWRTTAFLPESSPGLGLWTSPLPQPSTMVLMAGAAVAGSSGTATP